MDTSKKTKVYDNCCSLSDRYTKTQMDEICENIHNALSKMDELILSEKAHDFEAFQSLVEACSKLHVKDLELIVFCLENVFEAPKKHMELFFGMLTTVECLLLKRK